MGRALNLILGTHKNKGGTQGNMVSIMPNLTQQNTLVDISPNNEIFPWNNITMDKDL